MLSVKILKSPELDAATEAVWRDMCAQNEFFRSPLLSPEFFREVSKVREDAFVAVYSENNKIIAFLAFHLRPNNFARPIGAPFSDYSALITYADAKISIQTALGLAGISKFRAIGWIDPYNLSAEFPCEIEEAHAMDFSLEEPPHSASKKHRKNVNRLRRHINEKYGEIDFVFDDLERSHFDEMVKIKRNQTVFTGVHDFLSPPWVQKLMENLRNGPRDGLHGLLLTMRAGGKPIAWQFGPRLGAYAHPWIFAYNNDYAQYSPGQIYLMDCAESLKANGITVYDLSTGSQQYKRTFCNRHSNVKHGLITPEVQNSSFEQKLPNVAKRLSRRIDQIACLELEFSGRVSGLIFAFQSIAKRIKPASD